MGPEPRQNYRFRADDRRSRLNSARSVLPLVLAEFSEYGRTSFILSLGIIKKQENIPEIPNIRDINISIIRECIENSGGEYKKKLLNLLKVYQVQRSRLREAVAEFVVPDAGERIYGGYNPDDQMHQAIHLESCVELIILLNRLWAFARNEGEPDAHDSIDAQVEMLFNRAGEDPARWPQTIRHLNYALSAL